MRSFTKKTITVHLVPRKGIQRRIKWSILRWTEAVVIIHCLGGGGTDREAEKLLDVLKQEDRFLTHLGLVREGFLEEAVLELRLKW